MDNILQVGEIELDMDLKKAQQRCYTERKFKATLLPLSA